MGRAREAALTGAVAAVAKYGSSKATMGDIAMMAGIAKATLYNHFRTRDDLYAAVVVAEIESIAAAPTDVAAGFDAILAAAAKAIGENAAVRRVARDEPAVLAALATPGTGPGWSAARMHIARVLADAGCQSTPAAVDLVLRYLTTQLLSPSDQVERAAAAELVTAAVQVRPQSFAAPALVGSANTSS